MDARVPAVGDVLVDVTWCDVTGVSQRDSLLPAYARQFLKVWRTLDWSFAQVTQHLVIGNDPLDNVLVDDGCDIFWRDVAEEQSGLSTRPQNVYQRLRVAYAETPDLIYDRCYAAAVEFGSERVYDVKCSG